MQSGRIRLATSGRTSGSGLAMANIIGELFKPIKIFSVNALGADTPMSTSAPAHASSSVLLSVLIASYSLNSFIPFYLPLKQTPLESQRIQFSGRAP